MASNPELNATAKTLQAIAKPILDILTVVVPVAITTIRKVHTSFQKLPQNALLFVYGGVFCFFGGTFPTLFAALQAAEHGGRQTVLDALSDLSDEAMIIVNETKKDDDVDENKDGKSDIKNLSSSEFLARKTKLVLKKMNPEKLDKAISSMYRVWLSVAAVLSIRFARTISMALSIADFLKQPVDRFITPTLSMAIPDDYDKWVPVVMSWIIKTIAMSIAWKIQVRYRIDQLSPNYCANERLWFPLNIQSVMSAFTSALSGGLMMARAAYQFFVHRKVKLFGMFPSDHTESSVDETMSYIFAALGFYFQFKHHFSLPFPLNLILWPFGIAEYYIKWTITARK